MPGVGDPLFEAGSLLDELPRAWGLTLWRLLVDLALWARVPPAERPALFHPRAGGAAWPGVFGLEEAVRTLRRHLYAAEPGDAPAVADACLRISLWAEGSRFPATTLLFAHAAALAAPGEAGYAHRVAMLARTRAECVRAEVWYRRAVTLGRRTGEWTAYARSLAGLGLLYRQKGNYPAAQRFTERFLRATRKYRLHDLEGDALHNLCALAIEQGHRADVLQYGIRAFEVYGPRHPNLPSLASDLAWFWMDSEGAFVRALTVFRSLLWCVQEPVRFLVMANIARAAGGAGDEVTYVWAASFVRDVIVTSPNRDGAAPALLDVAHGALTLGWSIEAMEIAERVVDLAAQREERKVMMSAEALRDAARNYLRHIPTADGPPAPRESESTKEADALASELAAALMSVDS